MPHLHIKKFNEIALPSQYDEVKFNFIALNLHHRDEKLISTSYKGEDFFLLVKEDKNRTLLKTDKLTRPASIFNVHKALNSYAKLASLDVLVSNAPEYEKNIHLKKSSNLKSTSTLKNYV